MKRIKSHVVPNGSDASRNLVRRGERILSIMSNDEEFDELMENDELTLSVNGHEFPMWISPEVWDYMEEFIMKVMCHEMQATSLWTHPYYAKKLEEYSKALNMTDFVY